MKATLIDHTQDPEFKIGHNASICYDSDTSDSACRKRTKSVVNKGHLACARTAYATFRVSGVSRVCSHQLVRHTHLSYLQRSQRYCSELEVEAVLPRHPTGDESLDDAIADHYQDCLELYGKLLAAGYPKGEARYVLPQASTTELVISGNFQAWIDFINLRTDKAAQWEIREVALEIQRQLRLLAPSVFEE